MSTAVTVVFAEVCREGDDWKFAALGKGQRSGLFELATGFGVDL
jgi:stress response protein SCP2